MKKVLIFVWIVTLASCEQQPQDPLVNISAYFQARAEMLEHDLTALVEMIEQKKDRKVLQRQFLQARLAYKKIESLTEFYFPGIAEAINGAAIDETEEYDDKIIEASGFQVVEEHLFSENNTDGSNELVQKARILSSSIIRLRQLIANNELTDANVFEAQRLQLLRIMSLGISGFDSPIALHSLPEAKHALKGVEDILFSYRNHVTDQNLIKQLAATFEAAYQFLDDHPDFDSFNRTAFITGYLNKLSEQIYGLQQELDIPNNPWMAAVNLQKGNYFEKDVFNTGYFAPTYNRDVNLAVSRLGKLLFFDPVLSGNNQRACSSCHKPANGFADNSAKSVAFNGKGEVQRNTPSLINSAFQKSQFWDQRVHFTEDQIIKVINNSAEMHGHINEASRKLNQSDAYKKLFHDAFGAEQPISNSMIQTALAAYIRSLQGMNSRFDQYMRGESTKLSTQEINGFNLFMGKAKCATCHFLPLFNGSVPPAYTKTESEVLGVPLRPDTVNALVDEDEGKFHTYQRELHRHAFKTPTVRNAAITAPYMHNGVYSSLEQVIDFYNRGGGAGIGIDLPNQTLPADKLNLTDQQKKDIIAFIHALTDTTSLTQIPSALPSLNNVTLDKRKVGGVY